MVSFGEVEVVKDIPLVFDCLFRSPERLKDLSTDQLRQRYKKIGFLDAAAGLGFRGVVLWGLSLNWANDV